MEAGHELSRAGDRTMRSDIQGLRAIAVSLVLIYHLWPGRLSGGFVGVDVFFVISGFLIGGHLLGEVRATGRVRLGRFWARRAKRLLPASLLVLLLVSVATLAIAPLSTRKGFLDEVVGSVLYVENWVLAHRSVDYLALGDARSPVQHYWSLSVEEQLYIALPVVLVVVVLLTRRVGRQHRQRLMVLVLAILCVASLVWSVVSTRTDAPVAYFSTATRAWEFLAGALLACVTVRPRASVRVALGVVGLVAIVTAAMLLDDQTPFPGSLALLPVAGAVLVLLAFDVGPVAWLSRLRPVSLLGDISYAVYLWHWPLVVLVPYVTDEPLTTVHKLAIVMATLVASYLSTFYLEHPVRMSPRLLGGPRRARTIAVCGLAASTVVASVAWAGAHASARAVQQQFDDAQALVTGGDVSCLGAGVMHGRPRRCADFGDLLVPPPASVGLDDYNRTECWATFGVSDLHLCGFGSDDPGAPRVLAVGDSHNNLYLIAYEQLAEQLGWHVDVAGRAGCSWSAAPQGGRSGAIADECNIWKQELADHIAASAPYDIILTTSDADGYLAVPEGDASARDTTVAGLTDAWSAEIARGSAVIALLDYPHAATGVVGCVEEFTTEAARRCALPEDEALPKFDAAKLAVAGTPGSASVTVRDLMCADNICPPVIGNVVVYTNPGHLTNTFVRTLVPFLATRIPEALERAEASHP